MSRSFNIWYGIFKSTGGRFFTVEFTKKNGDIRVLNGKIKNLSTGKDSNHITIWDRVHKSWRKVNVNTIRKFQCGNLVITV